MDQLKESEDYSVKIKHEVLELKKMNKEKTLIIDDLNFKMVNLVDFVE